MGKYTRGSKIMPPMFKFGTGLLLFVAIDSRPRSGEAFMAGAIIHFAYER